MSRLASFFGFIGHKLPAILTTLDVITDFESCSAEPCPSQPTSSSEPGPCSPLYKAQHCIDQTPIGSQQKHHEKVPAHTLVSNLVNLHPTILHDPCALLARRLTDGHSEFQRRSIEPLWQLKSHRSGPFPSHAVKQEHRNRVQPTFAITGGQPDAKKEEDSAQISRPRPTVLVHIAQSFARESAGSSHPVHHVELRSCRRSSLDLNRFGSTFSPRSPSGCQDSPPEDVCVRCVVVPATAVASRKRLTPSRQRQKRLPRPFMSINGKDSHGITTTVTM